MAEGGQESPCAMEVQTLLEKPEVHGWKQQESTGWTAFMLVILVLLSFYSLIATPPSPQNDSIVSPTNASLAVNPLSVDVKQSPENNSIIIATTTVPTLPDVVLM